MSFGFYMMSASWRQDAQLWTPSNLSVSPKIRLDHTTNVADVSGYASEWTNAGSIGGSFTQSNSSRMPEILTAELNGHRVLRLDGGNDFMVMGSSGALGLYRNAVSGWAIAVYKKRTTDISSSTERVILRANSSLGAGARLAIQAGGPIQANRLTVRARRLDGDSLMNMTAPAPSLSWSIALIEQNWATGACSIRENDAVSAAGPLTSAGATSNTAAGRDLCIGAADPLSPSAHGDVDLASVLACDSALLTADERQRINGYYAHEYALQSNLPADHPFRHVPPYITTPVLQPSFASDPVVFGFVAATNSGDVGVSAGDAVASEIGTLLNSEPALGTGEGIEVLSDGSNITVTLTGLTPPTTPAHAVVMDHKGNAIAMIALTGSGPYNGTGGGELVDGDVYYVSIEEA